MSAKPQETYAEAHRAASQEFRKLSREQMRKRLQEAGVLGVVPQVGDKVRVLGRMNAWRYGVVIGADSAGRVNIVHNDGEIVAVQALQEFAGSHRVQLVERPRTGQAYAVAARAVGLVGQRFDLATFDTRPTHNAQGLGTGALVLRGVLAAFGLAVAAVKLSDDKEWDEATGRYRDARGRLAAE